MKINHSRLMADRLLTTENRVNSGSKYRAPRLIDFGLIEVLNETVYGEAMTIASDNRHRDGKMGRVIPRLRPVLRPVSPAR
jgi:hypothetical protein